MARLLTRDYFLAFDLCLSHKTQLVPPVVCFPHILSQSAYAWQCLGRPILCVSRQLSLVLESTAVPVPA